MYVANEYQADKERYEHMEYGRSGKSGTRINQIPKKLSFFPACEQERNGCFFIFASFFRPKNTKIVLGYNKDKIVLRFTK